MDQLKNLGVGFVISFIGSIPLGYLNIVGYHVFQNLGWTDLVLYLAGIIIIEAVVVYLTLIFAARLSTNKKLLRYISLFSIVFLLALAFLFYASANSQGDEFSNFPDYSPFLLGIVLSAVNFIQLPFWIGWNLYLLHNEWISTKKDKKFYYLTGIVAGTFLGMLLFIIFLDYIIKETNGLSNYIMRYIIPLAFVGLAIAQVIRFNRIKTR